MMLLPSSFYARATTVVARELLGALLVRSHNGIISTGMIIETEAYTNDDPACHAFKGKTERNAALFGPVGHAYVYFIYGKHFCLNTVAHDKTQHTAGGVLIRALYPLTGIEHMMQKRGTKQFKNLTHGPGTITQALAITQEHNGIDLTIPGQLSISQGIAIPDTHIAVTPRIGISQGKELLQRYVVTQMLQLPVLQISQQ
jgi:DNA-3-methyladenine glycosylase